MRLGYVGVTSAAAHEATSSSAGRRGEHPVRVSLRHQGRDVGVMEVEPLHGERLDPRTLRVLNQLSGLVAIALQLAQVNRDLDSARTRIVQVRNEERRLLRRELHDGLGPALAGASLALVAVRNNNPTMRAQDIDLLERVAHELSGRAADMRGVARAILPPALDEGRLDEALNMLASVFAHDRFDVRAHDVDQLETERQIAIYHIAAEALMNAFKHGKASVCTITMTATSTTGVDLRVHDDGRGIQPGDVPGIGLRSMRERAHELGGTLSVDSDSSGTTIKVVLP
jgi:signal transduction histidine kinase